jgi:hypothetical protein
VKRFRSLTATVAAFLLLLSPLTAFSAERTPDTTPTNGKPGGVDIIGGWDGSTWRSIMTDPSGILRTTEEYPITTQRGEFAAGTLVPLHTGLKAVGNGWSASPYGNRILRVTRAATGGAAVDRLYLYLFTSDDNVTFRPLFRSLNAAATAAGSLADTAAVDTVQISIPSSPATFDAYYQIPDWYLGDYVQIWAKRDSTASTAQTLTTRWYYREL